MSFYVFSMPELDEASGKTALVFTCIEHPSYEGSRQSKAYLEGCLGCRAVYAVYKARKAHERVNYVGPMTPVLRIEAA